MATVFWDSRSIIFTDYLEKRRTITGHCADLLDRFDAELKKTASFSEKKVLFHHNDALAHLSAKLVELLSHPPYSPDPSAISIYFQT